MNFRLAAPSILVDLNGIEALAGIVAESDETLQIGAMTRQRALERDPRVAALAPLITEAMPHVAHPQIRNRGTLGGSLAHADPAAELPALAVALDATLHARSSRGERAIPAAEFFLGVFTTALEPDEILVRVGIPPLPANTGTAFEEMARRHGDYALAGAAAVVTLGAQGEIDDCRLVFFSVGDAPVVAQSAMGLLARVEPSAEAIEAAVMAVDADIEPTADIHASAEYRRHLTRVLARRTLARAIERAKARYESGLVE
jgi:carbon-monoxide dehydrogenase medium subunit